MLVAVVVVVVALEVGLYRIRLQTCLVGIFRESFREWQLPRLCADVLPGTVAAGCFRSADESLLNL